MKFNYCILAALLAASTTSAFKLRNKDKHACDFLDEHGEEVSSSLIDNEDSKDITMSNPA